MCRSTGMLCMLISLVLLFKYVARKRNWAGVNRWMAKCHKQVGTLFLFFMVVHTGLSIPILAEHGTAMVAFGFISTFSGIILAISGWLIGKNGKALRCHRWSAAVFAVSMVLHVFK